MNNKIALGNYVLDQPSKDYTKSSNGGEYELGHIDVLENGNLIGSFYQTSYNGEYCQVTGTYTKTHNIDIEGTDICFDGCVQIFEEDTMCLQDLKYYFRLYQPNVVFPLVNELGRISDPVLSEDFIHYQIQRIERGFDDTELWSLYNIIVKFTVPRLEALIELGTMDVRYTDDFNFILKEFKLIADDKPSERSQEAVDLFAKHFFKLWY